MKKILAALLTVATVITCAFAFTACDKKAEEQQKKSKWSTSTFQANNMLSSSKGRYGTS